jgi:hypothetical protein
MLHNRESGLLTLYDPGADKPISEIPTTKCVHCGGAFQIVPNSGKLHGFCYNCNGIVCGPGCAGKCVPEEQLLENWEKGRPLDYKPIREQVIWMPGDE